MESSFNPAAVGKQAKLNVTAAYALDMAGFEHNPRTMYLAADMPFQLFNHQQGVGVLACSMPIKRRYGEE